MQKVKVQRYVSGKIPQYAKKVSSDESSDEEDFLESKKTYRAKDSALQEENEEK